MEKYIDDKYLFVDNTILMYSGCEEVVEIPGKFYDSKYFFEEERVDSIGAGAFMQLHNLKSVSIPAGIKNINKKAFFGCDNLEYIFAPESLSHCDKEAFSECNNLKKIWVERIISSEEYQDIIGKSIKSENGFYVISRGADGIEAIKCILDGISNVAKAIFEIKKSQQCIFVENSNENLEIFDMVNKTAYTSEHEYVVNKINKIFPEPVYKEAEAKNDWYVRVEEEPPYKKTVLIIFDERNVIKSNNKYKVVFEFYVGDIFWQSVKRIVYDKKEYFVYEKNYFGTEKNLEYLKKQADIFDNKGEIVLQSEKESVYGKYKLLSVL